MFYRLKFLFDFLEYNSIRAFEYTLSMPPTRISEGLSSRSNLELGAVYKKRLFNLNQFYSLYI